jgi:hypothetical protein
METDQLTQQHPPPTKLVDVIVKDQNDALQLIVKFCAVAQQRGAFKIDESAKLYECIKKFEC